MIKYPPLYDAGSFLTTGSSNVGIANIPYPSYSERKEFYTSGRTLKEMEYSGTLYSTYGCDVNPIPYDLISFKATKVMSEGFTYYQSIFPNLGAINTINDVVALGFIQRGNRFVRNEVSRGKFEYDMSWSNGRVKDGCGNELSGLTRISINRYKTDPNTCYHLWVGSETLTRFSQNRSLISNPGFGVSPPMLRFLDRYNVGSSQKAFNREMRKKVGAVLWI